MDRAALAVLDAVKHLLPQGGTVAVLCGRGNNGGDGLAFAMHARDCGYEVHCLVAAPESELSLDTSIQCSIAKAQGVQPIFVDDPKWDRKLESLSCVDLVVDALLGTGAKGEVRDPIKSAIGAINRSGAPVVSVDIPSGILCDTGEELGESVWAIRTVTFGLPKPFLFQGIGLEHSGYWTVAEIGFPHELLNEPTDAHLIDSRWVANMIPERLTGSHKGENGHVLIVAGSSQMPGAATLAAKAAMRAGAGLVSVAAVPEVCRAVAANLPEAILFPLPDTEGVLNAQAALKLIETQDKFDSALIGPGMTSQAPAVDMLAELWRDWNLPSCIDADALNAVSTGVALPSGTCVLTPHPGEMSRLLETSVAEIQANRFRSTNTAAEKFGKTVVLKGAYSVIGDSKHPLCVNCSGNPGMASAGMGDVLGGLVATLLAQGLDPFEAATCGVHWHGVAGDIAAEEIGISGYLASEVADCFPKARAKLTETCCSARPPF